MTEEKKLPGEGIYFDMPEAEYRALPYFSRSFAEEVLCDLEEAEYRLRNPIEATSAMDLGTAIHSMFLEPEKFNEIYVRYPSFNDFPDKKILKTSEEIADFLTSVGEKKTGKKEDLIARAKPFLDPNKFVIWDEVVEKFKSEVDLLGKRILNNDDYAVLQGLRESFAKRKQIKEVISGGKAEVTIIWKDQETGVMCKCRLDFVRPEAITDIKSFSLKYKKPLWDYLFKEIIYNRYNLQFAIYREALETIIKKIRGNKAKVYGEVDPIWLEKFLENSRKQFFILFVRTAAPYQMKAIELEKMAGGNGSQTTYHQVAHDLWRTAIRKYANAVATGVWAEKEIETLDDIHVPNVVYQSLIY